MPRGSLIGNGRRALHHSLFASGVFSVSESGVPSIADSDNKDSCAISARMMGAIGQPDHREKLAGQKAGRNFEMACAEFLQSVFPKLSHLRPGTWRVVSSGRSGTGIMQFEQYSHLAGLAKAVSDDPELAAMLGREYVIAPDIVILREKESDAGINAASSVLEGEIASRATLRRREDPSDILHASISCKLTMRSDRAQNSRSEALSLIRHRKGRVPHIAVVTAEPLPSRLASLALGTGDLDCVYHIALPELIDAVAKGRSDDSREAMKIMVEGRRLKDISDLPLDLAV